VLGEFRISDCGLRNWLELFEEVGHGESAVRKALLKESGELLAIFIAIGKSTRANKPKPLIRKLRNISNVEVQIFWFAPRMGSYIRVRNAQLFINPQFEIRNPKCFHAIINPQFEMYSCCCKSAIRNSKSEMHLW